MCLFFFLKYPQNKSQLQEARVFPVRHLPQCYEAGSRSKQQDGQQQAVAQDEEALLQGAVLLRQLLQTYTSRLVLVKNLAEHAVTHSKAHPNSSQAIFSCRTVHHHSALVMHAG